MDKLSYLMSLCKCGVYVHINANRDIYQTARQALKELDPIDSEGISLEVMERMILTDTIVHIHFYPDTPVGSFSVFHYDLESALDESIAILERTR